MIYYIALFMIGFAIGWLIMSMWKTWKTRHVENSCGVYNCRKHAR